MILILKMYCLIMTCFGIWASCMVIHNSTILGGLLLVSNIISSISLISTILQLEKNI